MKLQKIKTDKKGLLGLETAKQFLVFLLLLAVISIAMFMGVYTIASESVIARPTISADVSMVNESIILNNSGNTPPLVANLTSCAFKTGYPIITNRTVGTVISSGNYTVSACTITLTSAGGSGLFANYTVNVTGFYQYTILSGAMGVANNISNGTTSFFNNIPTVLIVLGIVVIIVAIGLIVSVAQRFGKHEAISI